MYPMAMILRIAAFLFGDGMSVIKSNQSLTISSVQGQRIVQPMRFFRRWLDSGYNKPNPMSTFRIDNERQTIEIQQSV